MKIKFEDSCLLYPWFIGYINQYKYEYGMNQLTLKSQIDKRFLYVMCEGRKPNPNFEVFLNLLNHHGKLYINDTLIGTSHQAYKLLDKLIAKIDINELSIKSGFTVDSIKRIHKLVNGASGNTTVITYFTLLSSIGCELTVSMNENYIVNGFEYDSSNVGYLKVKGFNNELY